MTKLLAQFTCVRIVQANGMDLSLFDFDRDLTFAAFFLNAKDKTIYGRYGSRSGGGGKADSTTEGFMAAMRATLALHANYAAEKAALAAKTGPTPKAKVPEQLGELSRYSTVTNFTDLTERNCIHCHQVGRAEAFELRASKQPLSDAVVFPWPMPDALGLALASDKRATVEHVAVDSAAARAGFAPGDEIQRVAGQPIISVADVQWVLHRAPESSSLAVRVTRGGETKDLTLELTPGWRRTSGFTWRMSDHHLSLADLPQFGLGVRLRPVPDADRAALHLEPDQLALQVAQGRGRRGGGRRGEGGAEASAGLQPGDVIVALDGTTKPLTESEVFLQCVQKHASGDEVAVTVLRAGAKVDVKVRLR